MRLLKSWLGLDKSFNPKVFPAFAALLTRSPLQKNLRKYQTAHWCEGYSA